MNEIRNNDVWAMISLHRCHSALAVPLEVNGEVNSLIQCVRRKRRQVSALKENMGFGISSNIAPLQTDVKEQKAGTNRTDRKSVV